MSLVVGPTCTDDLPMLLLQLAVDDLTLAQPPDRPGASGPGKNRRLILLRQRVGPRLSVGALIYPLVC